MLLSTEALWSNIQEARKRRFLLTPDKDYSYSQLSQAITQWLGMFDRSAMKDGATILITTNNEFAAISCFIAALLDGKVPVLVSADMPPQKISSTAKVLEANMLVHDATNSPQDISPKTHVLCLPDSAQIEPKKSLLSAFSRKAAPAIDLPLPDEPRAPSLPEDPKGTAYVLFTSGTTSKPCGVAISRGNLFANLQTISRVFAYDKSSRIFNDMVLSHADGLVQGPILALANGCTLIRSGGFSMGVLEKWLERVRSCRATHFITVPTIWSIIDGYAAHDDYFDAPECISLQSVADKFAPDMWQRLEGRFSHAIASQYGLTETVASALYARSAAEMGTPGGLGKAIDCQARIDPLSTSEGELQLSGDNIFAGYWKNPDRTATSFTDDGWFKTGDVARVDADGNYTMLGRVKNIIMCGAYLIRPEEIDEAMLAHPAVKECVTIGLADSAFGEIPASLLVLDSAVPTEALFSHARQYLEHHKTPRSIKNVMAIPRGDSGKPQMNEVRRFFVDDNAIAHRPTRNDQASNVEGIILTLAAGVFNTSVDHLDMSSQPDDVDGWDSFSHLNLVLEVENHFDVRMPPARIAAIEKLADLRDAIGELQPA